MALSTFTLLCNCHHHPSPEPFHLPKLKLCLCETLPPHSSPTTPGTGDHRSTFRLHESDHCRYLI